MDFEDECNLRQRLRSPKRDAPGFTHSLHALWDAYLLLEQDYRDLAARNAAATLALRGSK